MKQSDCYDASYTIHDWGRAGRTRPAITAKRAREIFAAAALRMDPSKRATVNKGMTVGQAFEILSNAATPEVSDETVIHYLVSRNIVREFGRFLPDSHAQAVTKTRAQQIKSLMEDSGYSRADATDLVDGGLGAE